jgi:tetratricopeptide (TPR) repeat protein
MSERWALGACLLVLGLLVMTGCATITVPGFSDARTLQNDMQYEQAIQQYTEFVQMSPDNDLVPYAEYNVAQCYLMLGDKDKAEAKLNDVVKLYSESAIIQAKPDSNPVLWAQSDLATLKEHPGIMLPAPTAEETPIEQPSTEAAPVPAPEQ